MDGIEPQLRTERLLLRRWREGDLEPFASMNADPEVMKHFPALLSRAESDSLAHRMDARLAEHGLGPWAVELPGEAPFVGFVGLWPVEEVMPFAPSVEIGWRLAKEFWSRGLAGEAAWAAMRFGFEDRSLDEIVSYTTAGNLPSRRLMERLGMMRDPADDFAHPQLPTAHSLSQHVLYRIDAERFSELLSHRPGRGR